MKSQRIATLVASVAVVTIMSVQAQAIVLNFSTVPNLAAGVVFDNGGFSFTNASSGIYKGYSFQITDSSGAGDSEGDLGNINGTFSIGNITTSGSDQSAPVTGTGQLNIFDGSVDLTGTLVWDSISTSGTGGDINIMGLLNLTSISYSGGQSDLQAMALAGTASDVVSFSFDPGMTLTQLYNATSPTKTDFSGVITTAVPESNNVYFLGFVLAGAEWLRRKLRK